MKLDIVKIRIDGDIQPRDELDGDIVTEYANRMKDGDAFPPMLVMHDGSSYWLVDGYHRYAAHARNDTREAFVEVRTGTKRDAALAAVECNATHGKRRTNADKRRAVTRLLEDAEWGQWSDREIARRCGVDHKMVGRVRTYLSGEMPQIDTPRKVERGGTVYTQKTSNIGKAKPVEDEWEEVAVYEDAGNVIESDGVIKTTTRHAGLGSGVKAHEATKQTGGSAKKRTTIELSHDPEAAALSLVEFFPRDFLINLVEAINANL